MAEDLFGIVGTVVASVYQVENVVAEGGFGVVYRARHSGFRAPVALKCLKVPQHLGADYQRRFLEHFRTEAELMFRLSARDSTVTRPLHVDVMTAPNGSFVPFMVLEWLDGHTLDAAIRARTDAGRRPFTLPELMTLFEPVAKALERAHHLEGPAGVETIAHCDLKPENIFIATVGGERALKILDFGIAEVRGAASGAKGEDEITLFTPAYGAPEQWNPKELGDTGPWTDVWGLGLTLVEALVGKPVITGTHATVRAQILDRSRRPTPRTHGAIVSDRVEATFNRALAVGPRDRYPDAGSFWRALVDATSRAADAPGVSDVRIPDLVPLTRTPSRPEMAAARGPVNFEFDDGDALPAPKLDLDLPPDEPVPRRSLAPSNPSLSMEPPPVVTGALGPPPKVSSAPAPPLLAPTPSLAPLSARPRLRLEAPLAADMTTPGSTPPVGGAGQLDSAQKNARRERALTLRLVPGAALVAASIFITVLERAYAAAEGQVFTLGPLRTSWLTATLLVSGLGWCARELFFRG